MAEAPNPTPEHPQPASDPSMEDILASIRRILSEDEAAPDPAQPGSGYTPKPASMRPDEVLELDHSMMVSEPENAPSHNPGFQPHEPEGAAQAQPAPEQPGAAPGAPEPSKERLVAPEAAAAAAASVGSLVRTLSGRSTAVHRGGPTIEDLVREEIRPILKEWLDRNLPSVVERLVRAEIERVVNRDMG